MAITRTQRIASTSGSAFGTGAYTSASFTPSANSLLVVVAMAITTADGGMRGTDLTISDSASLTWTSRAATTASPAWSYGIRIWTAPVGGSPVSMTVSVDCGAFSVEHYRLEIFDYTSSIGECIAAATAIGSDADGDGAASITLSAAPATDSHVIGACFTGLSAGSGTITEGSGFTEINDSSVGGWSVHQTQTRTGSTSTTVDWVDVCATGTPFGGSALAALEIAEQSTGTVDQQAFRFGDDNGSESAHGWLETQGTNHTRALGSSFLLRFLLQATGDPSSASYTLRAQKNGAGGYTVVPVGTGNAEAYSLPTWGAVGTAASGTTSCTPAYPTGISSATSKLFCVVTGRSNTANTVPTMPAGWTRIGGLESGTGTWGVDTGTRRVDIFQKDTTVGDETGTVTVSLSGSTANTLRASIHRIEVASGYGIDVELVTGADTSNDTSYSATASANATFDSNRLVLIAVAQNLDTGTQTSQSITATGITFGTRTNRASTAVTNGNDHRHIVDTVPVSSGSGTVAPTYSYTVSASASGPTAFLVLRGRLPAVTNELYVATSGNITAGGEATTSRLTGGTGSFTTGRRWDDENGTDTIDLALDNNTEVEWSLNTQSPAANGDYWDFRVYSGSTALTNYDVTPRLSLGTPSTSSSVPRPYRNAATTLAVLTYF